jgi:hypothetical protein
MERGTHGRIRSVGYTSKLYTTFDAAQGGSYSANGGASPSSARSPDA